MKKLQQIVLVDDDEDDFFIFKSAIKTINDELNVAYIENCEEIFDRLNVLSPDIIFMDINMRGYNGIECLSKIRSDSKYDIVPIIMYSTSNNPQNINECYIRKANYYIVKASTFEYTVQALRKILYKNWQAAHETSPADFVIKN